MTLQAGDSDRSPIPHQNSLLPLSGDKNHLTTALPPEVDDCFSVCDGIAGWSGDSVPLEAACEGG